MPDWLNVDLGGEFLVRLLLALALVLVIFILIQVIKRLVRRYVEDPERQFKIARIVGRIGGVLAAILFLGTLFETTRDLITIITVVGAGLAIAMREALMSLFAWGYITVHAPFRPGDRIEINGIMGDVIDIRIIHTVMMETRGWVDADQSTGRIVHVPNSAVFLHGVYNYTRGFHYIWNELFVTVTFRSDWQAAHDIMLDLAGESAAIVEQQVRKEIKEMAQEYLIFYNILTPFVYVRIVENGIRLTLRYLCEARKRRGTEHALTISMLDKFKEHGGIELAYPALGVSRYDTPQFGPLPDTSGNAQGLHPSKKADWNPL
ncbi:MAG: mechanosensitive ion channel family protein [Rhodothermales bacterium]